MSFKLLQFSPQESTRVIRYAGDSRAVEWHLRLFVRDRVLDSWSRRADYRRKADQLGRDLRPGSIPGSKCWFLDVGWGNSSNRSGSNKFQSQNYKRVHANKRRPISYRNSTCRSATKT